jgi:hypothetical protein
MELLPCTIRYIGRTDDNIGVANTAKHAYEELLSFAKFAIIPLRSFMKLLPFTT